MINTAGGALHSARMKGETCMHRHTLSILSGDVVDPLHLQYSAQGIREQTNAKDSARNEVDLSLNNNFGNTLGDASGSHLFST